LHEFLLNIPNRWVAWFVRFFVFPRGRTYKNPSDDLGQKIVALMTTPGESRERLSKYAYTTLEPGNPLGKLQEALELAKENAPLEKRLRQVSKEGLIEADYLGLQIGEAEKAQVISKAEANSLRDYHEKVAALLDVDDFAPDEFIGGSKASAAVSPPPKAAKKPARKKVASKKKPATKKASRKKKASKA
jgi:acyl-CoA dehydrogenase